MTNGEKPVRKEDWDRWRWRIVAAFIALALANVVGFVMIANESASREQAERNAAATARNTTAIGKLTVRSCQRGNVVRAYLRVNPSNSAERNARARRLFPIVDCRLKHIAEPLPEARQQAFIRVTLRP